MTRTAAVTHPVPADETDRALRLLADGLAHPTRSPVLRRPDEQGLDHTDVTFRSLDGVPLAGWLVPAPGSDRIVVVNHPAGCTRAGDDEIDLLPDYRILHDAGYHVLCYDLRNCGESGDGNGGVSSSGVYESRDVLGSLRWVRSHPATRHLEVSLFGRGLGANAVFHAMAFDPGKFDGVRCLLAEAPFTERVVDERLLARSGIPTTRLDELERLVAGATGLGYADRDTREWAEQVCVPTLLVGGHADPDDLHALYDRIPVADKRLYRVRDGHLGFRRHPRPVLDWLSSHAG